MELYNEIHSNTLTLTYVTPIMYIIYFMESSLFYILFILIWIIIPYYYIFYFSLSNALKRYIILVKVPWVTVLVFPHSISFYLIMPRLVILMVWPFFEVLPCLSFIFSAGINGDIQQRSWWMTPMLLEGHEYLELYMFIWDVSKRLYSGKILYCMTCLICGEKRIWQRNFVPYTIIWYFNWYFL